MLKKLLYFIAILFVICDLSYSFLQHNSRSMDGDVALNVVPDEAIKSVLESPLGYLAAVKKEKYVNPNRFFSHWLQLKYQSKAPVFLQTFVDPVSSIYLSSAIAKTITQILLIVLLGLLVMRKHQFFSWQFLFLGVLITPFFQTNGYNGYMGIIDHSITYTFFYAVPLVFILLYFLPFLKSLKNREDKTPLYVKILWIPLAVVCSLSGALNPGIALVICLLFAIYIIGKHFRKNTNPYNTATIASSFMSIEKKHWFYLIPIGLLSLYSLYLGQYNSMAIADELSTWDLYKRLPQGVVNQFTMKLGFPILFIGIIVNIIITKKQDDSPEKKAILATGKWILLFAVFYILLLPLGGFRSYRSNVLRYDTVLPITVALIYLYSMSSLYIFSRFMGNKKIVYSTLLLVILCAFTFADLPEFDHNKCEKEYLIYLQQNNIKELPTSYDCPVLQWRPEITSHEAEINTQLLKQWNIIK